MAWTTQRFGDHSEQEAGVRADVLFNYPSYWDNLSQRCPGAELGTFEERMCLNLKSTGDIAKPSGDERHCFLLRRETAIAECMLTVVPRDWSEVGHVRGTQHSFTRGRGHSN